MPPLLAATLGALVTSWMTFVPSFMFIFVGAPYIERMRDNTRLTMALSAITAAVVGVVLNLAVWFGLNVLVPETGPPGLVCDGGECRCFHGSDPLEVGRYSGGRVRGSSWLHLQDAYCLMKWTDVYEHDDRPAADL